MAYFQSRPTAGRHFLLIGYTALFVLVFGIGAWAAVTQIAGAVVSSGIIEVEGNRQVVQHPDGGVIAEIDARDGDEVAAGEVPVEHDDHGAERDPGRARDFVHLNLVGRLLGRQRRGGGASGAGDRADRLRPRPAQPRRPLRRGRARGLIASGTSIKLRAQTGDLMAP